MIGKNISFVFLFVWIFLTPLSPPHLVSGRLAAEDTCRAPFQSVALPLTELRDSTYIRLDGQVTEFTGGLYPNGSDLRPPEHAAAGMELAAQVLPLDSDGHLEPGSGRVGFISVGMSNTGIEFGAFMERYYDSPHRNPRLTLVNGAIANQTAERWVDPAAPAWIELERQLRRQGLTPEQIQVAWVKQTHSRGGEFPAKAIALQHDLEAIALNLKAKFPNLKLAFFSSRTRSYAIRRGLSPEPNAFETGFSVKWMIEKQINNDPALGSDVAPFITWGPYLWIDGLNPRQDGRVWLPEDLRSDCTHPSTQGAQKVAEMLFEFFSTDPLAQGWFLAPGEMATDIPASSTPMNPAPTAPIDATSVSPSANEVSTPGMDATRAVLTPQPAATVDLPASSRSLPSRLLAQLGLAFVILVFLVAGMIIWLWLHRSPRV